MSWKMQLSSCCCCLQGNGEENSLGKSFSLHTPHTDEWRTNSRSCYINSCRIAREHKFRKEFLFVVACCGDKITLKAQGERDAYCDIIKCFCLQFDRLHTQASRRQLRRYAKWGKAYLCTSRPMMTMLTIFERRQRIGKNISNIWTVSSSSSSHNTRTMYRGACWCSCRWCVVVHSKCKYRSDSLEWLILLVKPKRVHKTEWKQV